MTSLVEPLAAYCRFGGEIVSQGDHKWHESCSCCCDAWSDGEHGEGGRTRPGRQRRSRQPDAAREAKTSEPHAVPAEPLQGSSPKSAADALTRAQHTARPSRCP